jgi:3'-phosphoadenosine 5'-phosphosulfate sulfotransferase (PAPS reductase)/FAD synthetase
VTKPIRVFSYGGGVQSNAVLVLQATGQLPHPYDVFMFANVGNDSENPDTLQYVEDIAKPYAARAGIEFIEVHKTTYGEPETLYGYMHRTERSIPIPLYMSGNGSPGRRACTSDFKIDVIDRAIREAGHSAVVMGLGISLDEYQRARDMHWYEQNGLRKKREYPLLDLRLHRGDCRQIALDAGLPEPPKSSCWFCPFHRPNEWIEMRRTQPELFERAVELERMLNDKRELLGKDRLFMHRALVPLDQAVGLQLPLWDDDGCDDGYCMV